MSKDAGTLDALLTEDRRFSPSEDFRTRAVVSDADIYERANKDRESYWVEWAEQLDWFRRWDSVLEWQPPHAKWFVGGKLNVAYNCLDRHLNSSRSDQAALIWEGEPG
ncbi:MAG: acetyl-coenzyme A synthetase N-terminal domain-containing protein, partial [Gemmatimonadota bacterium]|nr:acetyl-coenzyme A synthetase N-terminal domain-containing protein [Gemmatimonadota bacterium]